MTMNKNQVEGRAKEIEGTAKEAGGKLTGNKGLQIKGRLKRMVGIFQADYGDYRNDRGGKV